MHTKVYDIFKQNGELWSTVTYSDSNGWDFANRISSDRRRGVYAFVSKYGIEKVGKIENAKGVSARTYQYETSKSRIQKGKHADASDVLWDKMMLTELKNETLQYYFIPVEDETITKFGIDIDVSYIRSLEKNLSMMARTEGNPMRLSGSGN